MSVSSIGKIVQESKAQLEKGNEQRGYQERSAQAVREASAMTRRMHRRAERYLDRGIAPDPITRHFCRDVFDGPRQRATFVKPIDMLARTILQIENPVTLCPFLRTMDEEEERKQAEEKIKTEEEQRFLTNLHSVFVGGPAGIVGFGVLTTILEPLLKTIPLARIISSVVGLIFGGVIGVLWNKNYPAETVAAEKRLGIPEDRIVRLEEKVQRIAAEKRLEGKSEEEISQLTRVKAAFRVMITRYRRVHL